MLQCDRNINEMNNTATVLYTITLRDNNLLLFGTAKTNIKFTMKSVIKINNR